MNRESLDPKEDPQKRILIKIFDRETMTHDEKQKAVSLSLDQIVRMFCAVIKISICLRRRLRSPLYCRKNLSVFLSAPAMISILIISSIKFTPPYFQLP